MIDVTAQREAESRRPRGARTASAELVERGPPSLYCYELADEDPPASKLDYVSPKLAAYLGMTEPSLLADPRRGSS